MIVVGVRGHVSYAEKGQEIRVDRASVFVLMHVRLRKARYSNHAIRHSFPFLSDLLLLIFLLFQRRLRCDRVRVLQKLAEEKHVAEMLGVDAELIECRLRLTHLFGDVFCTVHVVAAVRVDGADQGGSIFFCVKVEHKVDKASDLRASHRAEERAAAVKSPN